MAYMNDDDLLRAELRKFGRDDGKITNENRPLRIKLLNHLKAQQDKEAKANDRQKKSPGRASSTRQSMINVQAKTDEDDERNLEGNDEVNERHLRRRTINISRPSYVNGDYSDGKSRKNRSPPRSPSRSQRPAMFSTPEPTEVSKLRPLENFSNKSFTETFVNRKLISGDSNAGQTPPRNSGLSSSFFGVRTRENLDDNRSYAPKSRVEKSITEFSDSEEEHVPYLSTKADKTTSHDSFNRYPPSTFNFPSRCSGERIRTCQSQKLSQSSASNFLSKVVPLGIAGFFAFVILVYVYNAFIVTPSPTAFISQSKVCVSLGEKGEKEVCLNDKERRALDDVIIMLAQRHGEIVCGIVRRESPDGFVVVTELVNLLSKKYEDVGRGNKYEVNFDNLLLIIQRRKEDWNISMKCRIPETAPSLTMECQGADVNVIASLRSEIKMLSLSCRIWRALSNVTKRIMYGFIAFLSVGGVIVLALWLKRRREKTAKEINYLANEIVRLLQNYASQCRDDPNLKPYLPVSHIRDSLIPLNERAKKTYIWNEAVKQLGENETRIIEEIHDVRGEETAVWTWSEIPSIDSLAQKPSLEESPTVKDSLRFSPGVKSSFSPEMKRLNLLPFDSKLMSSCLKVYNVLSNHTQDNTMSEELRDAVLDKCGQYHGILHIGCDYKIEEGVVFIKCISESAAHQNYKALHGWIYNDRLVSVKYVSPLVYKMIFPDSENSMVTLKSSTHRRRF